MIYNNDNYLLANAIRILAMDAVEAANSGHPGMPMGMADVATVLWTKYLKHNPQSPKWADRDRFILSAGHGSMLLYALLYLTGYDDIGLEDIKAFRQLGSKTAGHPEYGHLAGIETTTGPLGQGVGNAVGMAIAEAMLKSRFGDKIVNHYTYVIAGDGCLMEGISHEAASLAGHLQLGKLIILYDDNQISIDGDTSLTLNDDALKRFDAYGWHSIKIDGHDHDAIGQAIELAKQDPRPSLIACKTIIGFGAPTKQGSHKAHGAPLGDDEIQATKAKLGYANKPFDVPDNILKQWHDFGKKSLPQYKDWLKALDDHPQKQEFERLMAGKLPQDFVNDALKQRGALIDNPIRQATRVSSQQSLEYFAAALPELLGGSADLTGSNNTKTKDMVAVAGNGNFSGSYLHYGVREHAMAAAMNGISLHGGFIPYGGTFMAFSDYCRPSIRLAALMGIRAIFVMTHDSIGLGEDGPTHQPVEHLAALRAIPNLLIMRPADLVESFECWLKSIAETNRPSLLVLSRQALEPARIGPVFTMDDDNLSAKGGYIVFKTHETHRHLTLIATGSEVSLAIKAAKQLGKAGIQTMVVSMPCFELFREQSLEYRDAILGVAPIIAIEAGIRQGWDEWLKKEDAFIGMNGFGASAPAGELYESFGISESAIIAKAKFLLPPSLLQEA